MANEDNILKEKLKLLDKYQQELYKYRALAQNYPLYEENSMLRFAVERSLQISIEICLDMGRRIIAIEGLPYPETNRDIFRILGQEHLVSDKLSAQLQEMAGFRNLLVHDYAEIDNQRVYQILQNWLSDFDAFAEAIIAYLQSQ